MWWCQNLAFWELHLHRVAGNHIWNGFPSWHLWDRSFPEVSDGVTWREQHLGDYRWSCSRAVRRRFEQYLSETIKDIRNNLFQEVFNFWKIKKKFRSYLSCLLEKIVKILTKYQKFDENVRKRRSFSMKIFFKKKFWWK